MTGGGTKSLDSTSASLIETVWISSTISGNSSIIIFELIESEIIESISEEISSGVRGEQGARGGGVHAAAALGTRAVAGARGHARMRKSEPVNVTKKFLCYQAVHTTL